MFKKSVVGYLNLLKQLVERRKKLYQRYQEAVRRRDFDKIRIYRQQLQNLDKAIGVMKSDANKLVRLYKRHQQLMDKKTRDYIAGKDTSIVDAELYSVADEIRHIIKKKHDVLEWLSKRLGQVRERFRKAA